MSVDILLGCYWGYHSHSGHRAKILLQQVKEIYRGNSRIFVQGVIPPFIEVARMVKERKEAYGSEGFLFDIRHMKPGI